VEKGEESEREAIDDDSSSSLFLLLSTLLYSIQTPFTNNVYNS
jgi:hypothetical protein